MKDVFRTGAQALIKSRRVLKAFQSTLDSTAETVASGCSQSVAAAGEALAAADQRYGISQRAGEAAAAADQAARQRLGARLGISAESRSGQALKGLSERVSALSREFQEDLTELGHRAQVLLADGERGYQKLSSEVNKRVMATASNLTTPRMLASAIDPDALCFYDTRLLPGVRGRVALTIDDAPCHVPQAEKCMMDEVRELLAEHDAKATFFLCTDYVRGHEASLEALLREGHEVGNHCAADRSYGGESEEEFEAIFLTSEAVCEELRHSAVVSQSLHSRAATSGTSHSSSFSSPPGPSTVTVRESQGFESAALADYLAVLLPRWPLRLFRAPHADVSEDMRRVLRRHGFTNVLCDCFASDTTIIDPKFIADTLLSQVDVAGDGGSILVIHAPERGFREHNLEALRLLLAGLRQRGMSVMTVGGLTEAALAGGLAEQA